MKKLLLLFVILAGVDALTPSINTGAQAAIAPAIIAAIIGAVGSMASAAKAKQGAQGAGTAAAVDKGAGGGIQMQATSPNIALGYKTGRAPAQNPEEEAYLAEQGMGSGIGVSSTGGSIMQDRTQQANINPSAPAPAPAPAAGSEPPPYQEQGPPLPEGFSPDGLGGKQGEGFFGDMSTADKMATVASLASLLRGPGAPPPPNAGGGGGRGIDMQPVFLNTIYGRR